MRSWALGALSLLALIAGCAEDGLPLAEAPGDMQTVSSSVDAGLDFALTSRDAAPDLAASPDLALPPPIIDRVDPGFGPAAGGTAVTVIGKNFAQGLDVSIAGVAPASAKWVDAMHVVVTTAAHAAGDVPLVVENPDGQRATAAFRYFNQVPPAHPGDRAFPVTPGLVPLVALDYDGDKHTDLVTASAGWGTVDLLVGNGDGTFRRGPEIAAGDVPASVAVADFDGDKQPDFAVADRRGWVRVLLQGGARVTLIGAGTSPWSIAAADLNGDGNADFAVADRGGGTVQIYFGDGHGQFRAGPVLGGANGNTIAPYAIAIADVDGDKHLDVAAATPDGPSIDLYIYAGDGKGGFSTSLVAHTGKLAMSPTEPPFGGLVVADVDGDARPDLVTIAGAPFLDGGSVAVALNHGNWSYANAAPDYGDDVRPQSLVALDVDGDGWLDLAVTDAASDRVSLLHGDGKGGFAVWSTYDSGADPRQLVAADFDEDGRLDLAEANRLGGDVVVLLHDRGAGYLAPLAVPAGAEADTAIAADLDGDGVSDLVVASAGDEQLSVLRADGAGGFRARVPIALDGAPYRVLTGDLDGDGNLDLLVRTDDPRHPTAFLGHGDGTFAAGVPSTINGPPLALGDFDGDGKLDLIEGDDYANPAFRPGKGDGTFGDSKTIRIMNNWGPIFAAATGDLDGDKHLDLVLAIALDPIRYEAEVHVFLGGGDGTFNELPVVEQAGVPALSDLDGDGDLDLLVAGPDMAFLHGNGDGTFRATAVAQSAGGTASSAIADLNGDHFPDVVLTNDTPRQLVVINGTPKGGWAAPIVYGAIPFALLPQGPPAIGDFDGDGRIDIAVPVGDGVRVLYTQP